MLDTPNDRRIVKEYPTPLDLTLSLQAPESLVIRSNLATLQFANYHRRMPSLCGRTNIPTPANANTATCLGYPSATVSQMVRRPRAPIRGSWCSCSLRCVTFSNTAMSEDRGCRFRVQGYTPCGRCMSPIQFKLELALSFGAPQS